MRPPCTRTAWPAPSRRSISWESIPLFLVELQMAQQFRLGRGSVVGLTRGEQTFTQVHVIASGDPARRPTLDWIEERRRHKVAR